MNIHTWIWKTHGDRETFRRAVREMSKEEETKIKKEKWSSANDEESAGKEFCEIF